MAGCSHNEFVNPLNVLPKLRPVGGVALSTGGSARGAAPDG